MDKATRRQIKSFEKSAEKAARLKEKAATLLKEADDIEIAQKPLFGAIILKVAYATGLDALPLSTIVAGFAALRGRSTLEAGMTSQADFGLVVQQNGDGSDDDKPGEASIDLIVCIGRNTNPKRFAVLDQYLTWNGRNGEWSGKVTRAVLSIFEGLFEPRQLKYSMHDLKNAEGGSSNTSTHVVDNVANAVQDGDPTSSESSETVYGVRQAMGPDADDQTTDQAATTDPVPGEPQVTGEAMNSEPDEAVDPGPVGTAAGTDGQHQRPGTIGPVKSDTGCVYRKPYPSR
jgi:hypothetical protein